jgi:hypothetical protein
VRWGRAAAKRVVRCRQLVLRLSRKRHPCWASRAVQKARCACRRKPLPKSWSLPASNHAGHCVVSLSLRCPIRNAGPSMVAAVGHELCGRLPPVGRATLSCAGGAAEPRCVPALRGSIVAAEPAGRWQSHQNRPRVWPVPLRRPLAIKERSLGLTTLASSSWYNFHACGRAGRKGHGLYESGQGCHVFDAVKYGCPTPPHASTRSGTGILTRSADVARTSQY